MSDVNESEYINIVPISPDEEEMHALRLPRLEFVPESTSDWTRWTTGFGVKLQLPRAFEMADDFELPDQALWTAADGGMFLVTRHQGGGNVMTSIGFDGEPDSYSGEGFFHTQIAGRAAAISLARIRQHDTEHYYASADAGIAEGLGVGIAVMASSLEQRNLLLNALPTLQVEMGSPGSDA
jgi:hypothetical protein